MIATSLWIAAVLAVTGADAQSAAPPDANTGGVDAKSSAPLEPAVTVALLDGASLSGSLSQLTADQIAILSEGKTITLPGERLLSVVPQKIPERSAENPSAWIELVDGSKLTAATFTLKKGIAAIGIGGQQYLVPASAIRTVRFSKPGDPASPAWPAKVGGDATNDLLAVRKKDAIDFTEGVLQSVDENHVIFQLDGDSVPVVRAKVDGMILFHKAEEPASQAICVVDDCFGWRLNAKSVSLADGQLKVSMPNGQAIRIPWDHVTRLDFSAGKIIYLSDLEPTAVHWTPYLDFHKATAALEQYYGPRRDEGREHQPLAIGGKTYAKGMALCSRTTIEYRLPTGAKKFEALAGIDDSVRDIGQVRLEISADGKKLFDKPISGADGAVDIDLEVAGARRLSILVDYGQGLDAGDYLNLADARIVK